MKFKPFFIILIACYVSCKAPVVNHQVHHAATSIPELLSIGKQRLSVFEKPFQSIGVPKLKQQIRLDVKLLPYNQTSYKAYTYHKKQVNQNVQFVLKDSLSPTPNYIQLSVLDRFGLAETLNSESNNALQQYILEDSEQQIVSSILLNANEEITRQIIEAEEVYAITNGVSSIGLELVKDGLVFANLNLSELEPFSYALSNFCWGLDKRNRPEIKAIINGIDCPPNTKAKAYKLESPYNYKF